MKSLAPVAVSLAVAACSHPAAPAKPASPPPPAAPKTITLAAPKVAVGPYVHFEKTQHEKLTVKGIAVEGHDQMATDECVVAVDGGAIKELAVTFTSGHFDVKSDDARIGNHAADLGGRTFHETFADGEPQFTEKGVGVTDPEVALALSGYQRGDVGRPYWLGQLIFDRAFTVNAPVALDNVRIGDTVTAQKMTVTLASLTPTTATFQLAATFAPDAPVDTFSSTVVVETATSHVLKLDNSLGTHGEVAQTFQWKTGGAAPAACP